MSGEPRRRSAVLKDLAAFSNRNMVAREALNRMNGSAGLFLVRPLVVMAARVLGPGRTRLKLVKLAHNLSTPSLAIVPEGLFDYREETVEPASRAA